MKNVKQIITITLLIHLTTLYACKKEEIISTAHYQTDDEQINEEVIEEVDSNLFNTWVLVKGKGFGPGEIPSYTYLDAPWHEAEDQDTLIFFRNNLCEYRNVKRDRVPIPKEWIYQGNNVFRISSRTVRVMELSKNHLIISMFGVDTGSAYYYEPLKIEK